MSAQLMMKRNLNAAAAAGQQQPRLAAAAASRRVCRTPAAPPRSRTSSVRVRAEAPEAPVKEKKQPAAKKGVLAELSGLGDALGPIGLTYSGGIKPKEHESLEKNSGSSDASTSSSAGAAADQQEQRPRSIARMTTAEWRAKYEVDGTVDLFVEEEFNAGSRLIGGRAVHWGGVAGFGSGEGPSAGDAPRHKVVITNPNDGATYAVDVPEDRYILWEAEDAGLELPYACRMGCCTACAVRVKAGSVEQVEALGVSQELRDAGYALMCVAYPTSDCELELADEDEVYELQFGRAFAEAALDPNSPWVERDDYALEIAQMDE
jgi:ferredoxin